MVLSKFCCHVKARKGLSTARYMQIYWLRKKQYAGFPLQGVRGHPAQQTFWSL